jgi:DNA-binding GntR family transcriptional regulator
MPTQPAAALKPARRQTLGESVTASLRDAIYNGRFRPGQRIAQNVVSQELGVSQAPVRDALAVLEREGLVQRATNQGAVVTSLSRTDMEEISSLRTTLEALAVKRLIRLATPDDLQLLEENIRTMEQANQRGQAGLVDLQFHELLVRAARHGRLLASWQALRAQLQLVLVYNNLIEPGFARSTARNHRRLLALIRRKTETAAVAELERQTEGFFRAALKYMAEAEDSSAEGQPCPAP